MIRVRLSTTADARVCLESPYDAGFVARLKGDIPYGGREWDASTKRWYVSLLYVDDLLQMLRDVGAQVKDDRQDASGQTLTAVPPMPADLRMAFDALFLAYTAPLCVAEGSYRALAKYWHPDHGGDAADFHRVGDAIQTIRHYLDPKPGDTLDDDPIPF